MILVENALRVAAINTVGDFVLLLGKVCELSILALLLYLMNYLKIHPDLHILCNCESRNLKVRRNRTNIRPMLFHQNCKRIDDQNTRMQWKGGKYRMQMDFCG